MRSTSHGDYLIQLTRLWVINCYFVREADGLTLIDTGMSGSAGAILSAAAALGQPIRRILLTHAHVDHVGSLDALAQHLPQAEVMISARDARFMRGDKSLDEGEGSSGMPGGFPVCKTVPTRLLATGDRVGSLEVIAAPGHTPGHMAFLDQRDQTLIAGDAYTTTGGISTGGTLRLLFPLPAMATWSKSVATRTAAALLALKPARLAVGHGPVLENPAAAMQKALDEARRLVGE